MQTLATVLLLLVAVEHVWILVLEMFLWTKPLGLKTFRQSLAAAQATRVLAANQGLYNGFLAAGLFWSVATGDRPAQFFFIICVVVAGIFGGLTAKRSILYIQGLPALLALLALLAG